ncbi:MAG TPA: hypothetical protein VEW71_02940 [Allosphingosinicella sp.]|nr:hypothetical protein [Allosphingosinicella sp.]
MDILGGIAAATNALKIAGALKDIEKKYDAAELKSELAELLSALADTKSALVQARDEVRDRDEEIERLKSAFHDREELVVGPGDYKYRIDDSGKMVGYPFCPTCESTDGRVVQLKQDGGIINAKCPVCGTRFSPVTAYLNAHERTEECSTAEEMAARNLEEKHRKTTEAWARLNRGARLIHGPLS